MAEHPRDRLARLFGLGKYGEKLAQEILDDYAVILATKIRDSDTDDYYASGPTLDAADLIDPRDPFDIYPNKGEAYMPDEEPLEGW